MILVDTILPSHLYAIYFLAYVKKILHILFRIYANPYNVTAIILYFLHFFQTAAYIHLQCQRPCKCYPRDKVEMSRVPILSQALKPFKPEHSFAVDMGMVVILPRRSFFTKNSITTNSYCGMFMIVIIISVLYYTAKASSHAETTSAINTTLAQGELEHIFLLIL